MMDALFWYVQFPLFESLFVQFAAPQGTLRGSDQNTNIILADSHERLFSVENGVQAIPLGLYIIRGDNM